MNAKTPAQIIALDAEFQLQLCQFAVWNENIIMHEIAFSLARPCDPDTRKALEKMLIDSTVILACNKNHEADAVKSLIEIGTKGA